MSENSDNNSKGNFNSIYKNHVLRNKVNALYFCVSVCFILTGGFLYFFSAEFSQYFSYSEYSIQENTIFIKILSGFIFIFSFGILTFLYASGALGDLFRSMNSMDMNVGSKILTQAADAIVGSAEDIKNNKNLNETDRSLIKDELETIVKNEISSSFIRSIDQKYGNAIINENLSRHVISQLEITKSRLLNNQVDLSKKASSFLAWGMSLSVVGLAVLAIFIFIDRVPGDGGEVSVIFHYINKFGLFLFIEIVSFFFLKMYKDTLNEIKGSTKEITNVELRLMATSVAIKVGGNQLIRDAISNVLRVERGSVFDGNVNSIDSNITVENMTALSSVMQEVRKIYSEIKR